MNDGTNLKSREIYSKLWVTLSAFILHKYIITLAVIFSKGNSVWHDLSTLKGIAGIFIYNFSRWDSNWYINIARNGYYSAKSTAFFPLYPLLMRVLGNITGISFAALGVLISSVSFLVALYFVQELVEIDFNSRTAKRVVFIIALNPVAYYFTSVYTESLFLMLTVMFLYCIRNKKWLTAGILGALCSATRNIGVFLVLPFAIEYLYMVIPAQIFEHGLSFRARVKLLMNNFSFSALKKYKSFLYVILVPLGLFSYMFFQYEKYGSAFTFVSSQQDYGRSSMNPVKSVFVGLWVTYKMFMTKYGFRIQFYYLLEFLAVLAFILLSVLCIRKIRLSYWMLMFVSLIIPMAKPALTPRVIDYFVSFPRYLIVSFPFFLCLCLIAQKKKAFYGIFIAISIIFLVINVYFWSMSYWIA